MYRPDEALVNIYALHFEDTKRRLVRIERHLGISHIPRITTDLRRNAADVYRSLCDGACNALLTLFNKLLRDAQTVNYSESDEILEAFEFVQLIAATALWKYRIPIPEILERFAREFDRLDVPSERRRLYDFARQSSTPSQLQDS
jgi:hypothetical protein